MKTLIEKPWEYVFYESSKGHYFLSVLCGTIAVYDINLRLTHAEKERFLAEGEAYLDMLAGQVVSSPNRYADRHVNIED